MNLVTLPIFDSLDSFGTDFRTDFLAALPKPGQSPSLGMFIDSCNAHCQSGAQDTWLADGSPLVNKTVSLILRQ